MSWSRRRKKSVPTVLSLSLSDNLDLQYIDRWSLWMDTKILLRITPLILRGTGAS